MTGSEQHRGERERTPPAAPIGARMRGWSAIALGFVRVHAIALAIVAGLLLVYALAGFFLVPRIARSQIQDYVTGTLHKKISLGELRFNPFTFDASVAGLRLSEDDDSLLVAFRHLYVNAELASLWQRAVVLKEVELSAPDVQLVIARDGSVNLARLVPAQEQPKPPQEEAAPPRVRIGRLAVTQGRVGLEDRTRSRPFTAAVTPIRFVLLDFRTDLGYRNAYSFTGTTTSGEQLQWSGGFTVQPLGSSGVFAMQGLKLATIDSYLYESLPFRLAAGEARLEGAYQFALEPFALDLQLPRATIRNATLAQRGPGAGANAPVTLPEVDAQQLSFSFGKRDVGLQRLDIRNAHVNVAREQDGTIDLSRLLDFPASPDDPGDESGPSPSHHASASDQSPVTSHQSPSGQSPSDQSPSDQSPSDQSPSDQSPSDSSPLARSPSPSWNIHIDQIQVSDAAILAEDRTVTPAARFEFTPVNLTVDGWGTNPGARARFDANAAINRDGRLAAHGEVQLDPLEAQLAIDLSGFELPAIQPYLSQTTAMTLHSGTLAAKGDVSFATTPENAPPLKFAGEVQMAGLRTTDQFVDEDFVKWRNLALSGIRFGLNPDGLSIDSIVARQPYASVIIARDRTLNIAAVLAPSDDSDKGRAPAEGQDADAGAEEGGGKPPPLPIRIRSVRILGGSANFADYSVEPSFATGILDLNGRITGLSSDPASRAQVALQGKVDRYAPVDITGEVNILAAAKYTDLAMNFRNMELTTFNPYSGKFAGYNISRGKLSTELKYRVEDRKLLAEHHIVIDNLEFGDKTDSKDAAPIPIKLAVALLKDRNGVIDVNLPVSGSLDDPKFRLGPLIWKAALGLLKKIVTAPFAALGALFGGGEELAYVDFPAGSAELGAAETDKLTKLSKALVERPQLKLNIPLTVIGAADSKAIATRALAARVPEDIAAPTADEGADEGADEDAKRERIELLEDLYEEVAKTAPEYPADTMTDDGPGLDARLAWLHEALIGQLSPDQSALDALARQRARAVQDALLANPGLDPGRVFITSQLGGSPAEGDRVRMEMKLE